MMLRAWVLGLGILVSAGVLAAEPRGEIVLDGEWLFRPLALAEKTEGGPPPDGWTKTVVPAQQWPRMDVQRAWYRRDLAIPKDWQDKRMFLRFEAVAYGCRPYLDGRPLGYHLGGFTPFEFEITEYVRAGMLCRLDVFVEGALALLKTGVDKSGVRSIHEAPPASVIAPLGGYRDDQYRGITQSVRLLARPRDFISDVFVQPSVARRELRVRFELDARQTTDLLLGGYVRACGVAGSGKPTATLRFVPLPPPGPAGAVFTLSTPWGDPVLWWPDRPYLYELVSELRRGEELIDRRVDRFGFREFRVDGDHFTLNGVRVHLRGRGDSQTVDVTLYDRGAIREFLAWHKGNANVYRTHIAPKPRAYYEVASEIGVMMVGESEICFDYHFDLDNPEFWANCERLWEARVRRDRNEPSIVIWSVANEFLMAHARQKISDNLWRLGQRLKFLDPTRPVMFSGDGDLRNNMVGAPREVEETEVGKPVEIINLHPYDIGRAQRPPRHWMACTNVPRCFFWPEWATPTEVPNFWGLSALARNRPWYMGEFGHAIAAHPDVVAFRAGDAAYRDLFGRATAFWEAVGDQVAEQVLAFRILGMAGISPWWDIQRNERTEQGWRKVEEAFTPVRVALHSPGLNFFADEEVKLDLVILHDAYAPGDLTLTWQGRSGRGEARYRAGPGEKIETTIVLPPHGKAGGGTSHGDDAEVEVILRRDGKETHRLRLPVRIYPRRSLTAPDGVVLYDPAGTTAGPLRKAGLQVPVEEALEKIVANPPALLLVGESAAEKMPGEATAVLCRYLDAGGSILCLRQNAPVRWLPGWPRPVAVSESSIVFVRHREHPAFRMVSDADLRQWRSDGIVSRGNFQKPTRGNWRALCDVGGVGGLRYAAVLEMAVGQGRIILCQLDLVGKLDSEPAARVLLDGLLAAAATSPKPPRARFATGEVSGSLARALRELGCSAVPAGQDHDVLLLEGGHLENLPDRNFVAKGGVVVLHALKPGDEAAVGRLLGGDWRVRESGLQHPQLELAATDPVCAGITGTDLFWLDLPQETELVGTFRDGGPIVRHVVDGPAWDNVKVLVREAAWTTNFGRAGRITAGQRLAATQGQQLPEPGAALLRVDIGNGFVVIDQILWDEQWASSEKAQRLATRLLDNLGIPLRATAAIRLAAADFDECALRFRHELHVQSPRVSFWCENDSVTYHLDGLAPGRYLLRVRANCATRKETLRVHLDGRAVHDFAMRGDQVYTWDSLAITDAHRHRLTLTMPEDVGDIFIEWVELERIWP